MVKLVSAAVLILSMSAPALADGLLLALGTEYHARLGARLGATRNPQPATPQG